MRREQIRAKRSRLERREPRSRSSKRHVRHSFSLEHLAYENELAALVAVADAVADHAFAEHGREFRREVAHLVRVRKQNQIRLRRFDDLLQCHAISIRRIRFEQIVFDAQNFRDVFSRQLVRERCHTLLNHQRAHHARRILGNLLRRGQRFETCLIPLALALLGHYQNFHRLPLLPVLSSQWSVASEEEEIVTMDLRLLLLNTENRKLITFISRALQISTSPPASSLLPLECLSEIRSSSFSSARKFFQSFVSLPRKHPATPASSRRSLSSWPP